MNNLETISNGFSSLKYKEHKTKISQVSPKNLCIQSRERMEKQKICNIISAKSIKIGTPAFSPSPILTQAKTQSSSNYHAIPNVKLIFLPISIMPKNFKPTTNISQIFRKPHIHKSLSSIPKTLKTMMKLRSFQSLWDGSSIQNQSTYMQIGVKNCQLNTKTITKVCIFGMMDSLFL